MKTPLQQLTHKIYTKLPELKQLGVGCEIRTQKYTFQVLAKFNNSITCIDVDNKWIRRFEIDKHYLEIIGKPPTLVDVRNWMKTLNLKAPTSIIGADSYFLTVIQQWNDSIYLRDQDEALINFLNDL